MSDSSFTVYLWIVNCSSPNVKALAHRNYSSANMQTNLAWFYYCTSIDSICHDELSRWDLHWYMPSLSCQFTLPTECPIRLTSHCSNTIHKENKLSTIQHVFSLSNSNSLEDKISTKRSRGSVLLMKQVDVSQIRINNISKVTSNPQWKLIQKRNKTQKAIK